MILTVTLNPCIDKTLTLKRYRPGEKNQVERVETIAGGKGVNVARMVHHLGVPTTALYLFGGTTGLEIGNLLSKDGIPCHGVPVGASSRVITTVRETLDERHTVFFEPGPVLTGKERTVLLEAYESLLSTAGLVVLAGALPNTTCAGIYPEMIARARDQGKKVILDSHGTGLAEGIGALPFLVKPNQEEAAEITGQRVESDDDALRAAGELLARGIEAVVISLGRQGALLATPEIVLRAYPPPVKEVNPVGSGDSLVAGLAVGMLRGFSWEEALRLGTAAGAANAAAWQAGSCTREQVETLAPQVEIVTLGGALRNIAPAVDNQAVSGRA